MSGRSSFVSMSVSAVTEEIQQLARGRNRGPAAGSPSARSRRTERSAGRAWGKNFVENGCCRVWRGGPVSGRSSFVSVSVSAVTAVKKSLHLSVRQHFERTSACRI